jgi:hypothetical protein
VLKSVQLSPRFAGVAPLPSPVAAGGVAPVAATAEGDTPAQDDAGVVVTSGRPVAKPPGVQQHAVASNRRGITPLEHYLMRESYPGYLAAKLAMLLHVAEHRQEGSTPLAIMTWDGGSDIDLAHDLTTAFRQSAAVVLEPNKKFYKFIQQMTDQNGSRRVLPLNDDILTHKFNGRYDVIASLFGINRLSPEQFRQTLRNVRKNGLMPDGLFLFAGQFVQDNGGRLGIAKYYSNVLFHCLAHHNLKMAQWVLGDWYQMDAREGRTLINNEEVEKILNEEGFYFFRERVWPQYALNVNLTYPDYESGLFVYKAWIKNEKNDDPSGQNTAPPVNSVTSSSSPLPPQPQRVKRRPLTPEERALHDSLTVKGLSAAKTINVAG